MRNYVKEYKSAQFLKKGGKTKIHIKPENRGKFTEYCGGKVTNECIQRGLKSPDAAVRKMANFARNSRKWKHQYGGQIFGGIAPLDMVAKDINLPNDKQFSSVSTTRINFPEIPREGAFTTMIKPSVKQHIWYGKNNMPNDTVYTVTTPGDQWATINKTHPDYQNVQGIFNKAKTDYRTPEYMVKASKGDSSGVTYPKVDFKEMGGKIEQILKTYEETKSIGSK